MRQSKALSRLRDKFAACVISQAPSSVFNEIMPAIVAEFPKLPRYERTYLNGYNDCMIENLYRERLVFGGFYRGQFYSAVSGRLDYYGHAMAPALWATVGERLGHYWTDERGKCNGSKPFYVRSLRRAEP